MESFNPQEFADVSSTIFRPAYPLIASQALERTGVRSGTCLDLGAGTGSFGFEVSKKGNFTLVALDSSLEILKIGSSIFTPHDTKGRVFRVAADVRRLPLKGCSFDLVISRGSVFFWNDLKAAFLEILRVLKPSRLAYIGGGFGSKELKERAREALIRRCQGQNRAWKRPWDESWLKDTQAAISSLDVWTRMINDDTGLWFMIKKPG
jgi:ubiquinone/menaquinone biosynthesis C-methylase UbiE